MNENDYKTPAEREAEINAANARMNAAIAQDAARNSRAYSHKAAERNALGSWLVAGSAAFAGLIGLGIWANSVNNGTATASSASQPPVVIERRVMASPSPASSPIIVREYVPVPVPGVPAQPTPAPIPPAAQVAPAPPPLSGYSEPAPRPAPSIAAPTPPVQPATPSDPNAPLGGYIER